MDWISLAAWRWIIFNAFIITLIALDLGLFQRRRHEIALREALITTGIYVALALAFNAWIYARYGNHAGLAFFTSYFIEYSLSLDNILVFIVILAHFQVPAPYQMRVLLWGVFGALILRGIFIFAGIALLSAFEWVILLMGLLLIYTGVKSLLHEEITQDIEQNRIVRLTRRVIPMTPVYHGEKFFQRLKDGKLRATPLLLVLLVLSITDVIFAIDSIPAVFAITRDPFIVYTSNAFAVLGLRALYFALAGVIDKFRYLQAGISIVLIFIGVKMIYNYLPYPDIPASWVLAVTAVLIFGSVLLSLFRDRISGKEPLQR